MQIIIPSAMQPADDVCPKTADMNEKQQQRQEREATRSNETPSPQVYPPPPQVYPPPSYANQHQAYHSNGPNGQQPYYPPPNPNMPPNQTAAYYIPHPPMTIWGRLPQRAHCPYCRQEGVTEVNQYVGTGGIIIAALLFIFTCCCCLVWCCDDCKDAGKLLHCRFVSLTRTQSFLEHRCPHCKQIIGQRKVINSV